MVDPGSRGNLAGDIWAKDVAALAIRAGKTPKQTKRNRPLEVMGVGNGSQVCNFDMELPIAMTRSDGRTTNESTFTTPVVGDGTGQSELPGLLGLSTMAGRTILDMRSNQLHFLGPGEAELMLPPGSETFQCVMSPSGHLMIPCSRFLSSSRSGPSQGSLTIDANESLHLHSSSSSSATRVSYRPVNPEDASNWEDRHESVELQPLIARASDVSSLAATVCRWARARRAPSPSATR